MAAVSKVTGRGQFTVSCAGKTKTYSYSSRLKAKRKRIKFIKALNNNGLTVSDH